MQETTLTPSSYIVLGLLAQVEQATPYDLKQMIKLSVGYFWSLPHSQVYGETERLAASGHIFEKREQHGRRRKLYAITKLGRRALKEWLDTPTDQIVELRDLGLLKAHFGGDLGKLAPAQHDAHEERLRTYEEMLSQTTGDTPEGGRAVLEAGIAHEREYVRFWKRFL